MPDKISTIVGGLMGSGGGGGGLLGGLLGGGSSSPGMLLGIMGGPAMANMIFPDDIAQKVYDLFDLIELSGTRALTSPELETVKELDNDLQTKALLYICQRLGGELGMTNVALESAGSSATASSSYDSNYLPSRVINGHVLGSGGSGYGWWHSSTANNEEWLIIDFGQSRAIRRINLFSVQDNYNYPIEPYETMIGTNYLVKGFDVYGLNGASWLPIANIVDNPLIKRTIDIAPFTTNKIKIVIPANKGAPIDGYKRIAEVQCFI